MSLLEYKTIKKEQINKNVIKFDAGNNKKYKVKSI